MTKPGHKERGSRSGPACGGCRLPCTVVTIATHLRLGIARAPSGLTEGGAEFRHTRGLPLAKWTGLACMYAEKSYGHDEDKVSEGRVRGPGPAADAHSVCRDVGSGRVSALTALSLAFFVFVQAERGQKEVMQF